MFRFFLLSLVFGLYSQSVLIISHCFSLKLMHTHTHTHTHNTHTHTHTHNIHIHIHMYFQGNSQGLVISGNASPLKLYIRITQGVLKLPVLRLLPRQIKSESLGGCPDMLFYQIAWSNFMCMHSDLRSTLSYPLLAWERFALDCPVLKYCRYKRT